MKQKHALFIMTGFLIVSAALITGLASANMTNCHKNKSMIYAQKVDNNDDGAISLEELTARRDRRFVKLDHDENGVIERHEFNARLISMFHRMDRDGDGLLRTNELPVIAMVARKLSMATRCLNAPKQADFSKDASRMSSPVRVPLPRIMDFLTSLGHLPTLVQVTANIILSYFCSHSSR